MNEKRKPLKDEAGRTHASIRLAIVLTFLVMLSAMIFGTGQDVYAAGGVPLTQPTPRTASPL